VHRTPLPSPDVIASLPPDGGLEFNRMVFEGSPYLRQHARNPVDWRPWGHEAFELARRENKPVFLSIGYSACHWCHVMEHESFEDPKVAALLNQHFVSIKVDREERPDIDQIYMTATQVMTGHGGWPNSIFMDHRGRPFFCGTYFPKEDRGGRPGFLSLLAQLSEVWVDRPELVEEQSIRLSEAIRGVAHRSSVARPEKDVDIIAAALNDVAASFDAVHGGFGGAPKFPPHAALRLLLTRLERGGPGDDPTAMLTTTLDRMALGGIRDHIGGGFHRYATDDIWFLPHFEKMLYDNAQLASIYARAARLLNSERYADVAKEICDWVLRDLLDQTGAFHSAWDADSEGEEGRYYLWKPKQIKEVLGEAQGKEFSRVYNITDQGNYYDEATGHKTKDSIPHLSSFEAVEARDTSVVPATSFASWREALRGHRATRIPPQRDDKVIAGWNGLMISGLAQAGMLLDRPDYIQAAAAAAHFVLERMVVDGRLHRVYREGVVRIPAYLDDYAWFCQGLLDLHVATTHDVWLHHAETLMTSCLVLFRDEKQGGFFYTASDHETLLVREKDAFDNATPSANGSATLVLARLATLTGRAPWREAAVEQLEAFSGIIARVPQASVGFVEAGWMLGVRRAPSTPGQAHLHPVTARVVRLHSASSSTPARAEVELTFAKGWHSWPNPAPITDGVTSLIATRLEGIGSTTVLAVEWPAGVPFSVEGFPVPLPVYRDTIRLSFTLISPVEATPRIRIIWQACNDKGLCLPEQDMLLDLAAGNDTSP